MQRISSRAAIQPATSSSSGKSSDMSKAPTFQFISPDELQNLYEQRKGTQYFIPEGFEPVLIPCDASLQPVANLLLHKQQQQLKIQQANLNAAAPDVVVVNKSMAPPISLNNNSTSDVRFPQLVLARTTTPTPRGGAVTKAVKPKKPPRPPNAFILYRRQKQPTIVAANEGISNNEVSKQVGEMWHKEPLEEKMKYQRLADTAKLEHMRKYPEYKYRPRRPHEKRRRTKRPNTGITNVVAATNNKTKNGSSNLSVNPASTNINVNGDMLIQQPIDRRASVDTESTLEYYEDESGRISNEFDEFDYDQMSIYENIEDIAQLQYPVTSCPPSTSPNGYNVCVETTTAFDLMMESVSPGSEPDVNSFGLYNFGYTSHPSEHFEYMQFNNTFDLGALISSPVDGMICEHPSNMDPL